MSKNIPPLRRQTGITGITIENFKGIGAPVAIPLRPITLLFGANSAGKSTIIQAIHYARELLERNNADADIPSAGGNAIDLGGFRNMVHRHDYGKTIRIGFEITPDDDGIPGVDEIAGVTLNDEMWRNLERIRIFMASTSIQELQHLDTLTEEEFSDHSRRIAKAGQNSKLVEGRKPDISPFARKAGIQLAVSWDSQRQQPWLSEVRYSLDGRHAFAIRQENQGAIPFLNEIDYQHPSLLAVFTPILNEDAEGGVSAIATELEHFFQKRQDSLGRVFLRGQSKALPDLSKPLPLGVSMESSVGGHSYDFFIAALLNQITLGTTKLLKDELQHFRYVGPIRERPLRNHQSPAIVEESRWADGSAAWDLILKHFDPTSQRGDSFVQEISRWISQEDRLDLGYSIDVLAHRNLPEASMLMANLRLLRDQFDEKDQDFYRRLVWPGIENAEIRPRLELRDLKNDVAVGPTDLGIGVIQVIPVITASLDPSKRIVAVEQPELHLHPRVACDLGDLFIDQISKGKLFLIETHSEHLLLRIMRRIREYSTTQSSHQHARIQADDVAILFIENFEASTIIRVMPLNERGELIKAWPGGFFEEDLNEVF